MKSYFFILLLNLSTLAIYAQDSSQTTFNIKDYSLRDYIAPDIQYRRLTLGTDVKGNGSEQGSRNHDNFNGYGNLNLYNYTNLTNYQGNSSTYFNGSFKYNSNKVDTNKGVQNNPRIEIGHYSHHRLYNSKNRFFNLSPRLNASYYYNKIHRKDLGNQSNSESSGMDIDASLGLAIGTGRIQPVTAARRAMDILISMEKYQRLSLKPTTKQIDSLAYLANEINYKRFFDSRFKRVYQLAELDSAINALGLVDNRDMIYAANLSDIWDYGTTYSRGSGSRFEVGIDPGYLYGVGKDALEVSTKETTNKIYTVNAFANWEKQVPLNYKWQSDISLSMGYIMGNQNLTNIDSNPTPSESKQVKDLRGQYINSSWTLGFYPNTRTHFRISPFVNLFAYQSVTKTGNQQEYEETLSGMSTGLKFNSYYYVSPRFRLELIGETSFKPNEYPGSDYFGIPLQSTNNNFSYSYQLKLAYALF